MSLTKLVGTTVILGGVFFAGMYYSGNPDAKKDLSNYAGKARDVTYRALEPDVRVRINDLYMDLNNDKELLLKNRIELLQLTNYFIDNADKSSLNILKDNLDERLEE